MGPVPAVASMSWRSGRNNQLKVCKHWRAGNCYRFPCPFLHAEELPKGSSNPPPRGGDHWRNPNSNFRNSWTRQEQQKQKQEGSSAATERGVVKKTEKLCKFWLKGSCDYGENCKFLHSWKKGDCFSYLSELEGHEDVVTGIALPSGSDKLYTGSKDGTFRVWDCNSGQNAGVANLGSEICCMINEGPWIFVGLKGLVRVWNSQTNTDFSLEGAAGRVYSLAVCNNNNTLFAAVEDGSILGWKFDESTGRFEEAAALKGHTRAVVTLAVGSNNRLYSGSMDNSIRIWNLENMECLQIMKDHTDVVMSVLCWDQFLLSCSLDGTIKVWNNSTESGSGNLEVIYTHNEEHGLLSLCGMQDQENKPILLCSSNDNSVLVYDLPSFEERGKIFSKEVVRTLQSCPGSRIFFTGEGNGSVRVWKWEDGVKS